MAYYICAGPLLCNLRPVRIGNIFSFLQLMITAWRRGRAVVALLPKYGALSYHKYGALSYHKNSVERSRSGETASLVASQEIPRTL
jgi:hypothetical protein